MRSLLVLVAVITAALAHRANYDGYKVYRLLPSTEQQLHLIKGLTELEDYDVWSSARQGAEFVDVMVLPKNHPNFTQFLRITGIEYHILIEDVERLIERQRLTRLLAPKLQRGQITFTDYNTYDQIQAYLHKLAETYPHVTLENIGKSYEGRDLNVVKISSDPTVKKPIIFIDGGIHAREWISPATVLYFINQLAENPNSVSLLKNVDWHILPTINPDGYSYSFTTERMWRKTRSREEGSSCKGADPNRNFGFHWGGLGSGPYPCGDTYRGKQAFSESETQALRDYIWKIKSDLKLYLSFHSYGNYLLYPWSYTTEYPANAAELQELGEAVANGIEEVEGTRYVVGSSTNVLYETAGSSDDWVKGEAGVELAYTIELPGRNWGFLLPPEDIIPIAEETWNGLLKFHEYIELKYGVTYKRSLE